MNAPRKWLRSFRFAYEGLLYALSTQRNMKFHFTAALAVLLLALLFDLSKLEILFIILAITLIVMAELLNTAIEKTVDLAMPKQHPIAKIAKDVAAAAVLVSAVFAIAVGMIVFFEPVNELFRSGKQIIAPNSINMVWLFVAIVVVSVTALQTRFSKKRQRIRPSLISAISFAISTLMIIFSPQLIVGLLAFSLSLLNLLLLYEKTERSFVSLLLGGFIGTAITVLINVLLQWL